ncbi:hypothetical protein N7492_003631 [Penicillium capsulatum]|uniref:Uncharacterized protein n=1 Tax=Penicillium capsulatum TaxID=69766 RepID=A0A9W9IRI2_9EURO|nr:hypothetical protein N7492_003631 [Penicillium capsulatum]KAJ6121787.1 hypothetical protein N7512_004252 [Penicillium capsulatum]
MLFRQSTRQLARSSRQLITARTAPAKRTWASTPALLNATQNPSSYRQGMNAYKAFAGPFAKVFLGAVLTYQIIYWIWVKLETDEVKLEKNEEMGILEQKARALAAAQK